MKKEQIIKEIIALKEEMEHRKYGSRICIISDIRAKNTLKTELYETMKELRKIEKSRLFNKKW